MKTKKNYLYLSLMIMGIFFSCGGGGNGGNNNDDEEERKRKEKEEEEKKYKADLKKYKDAWESVYNEMSDTSYRPVQLIADNGYNDVMKNFLIDVTNKFEKKNPIDETKYFKEPERAREISFANFTNMLAIARKMHIRSGQINDYDFYVIILTFLDHQASPTKVTFKKPTDPNYLNFLDDTLKNLGLT